MANPNGDIGRLNLANQRSSQPPSLGASVVDGAVAPRSLAVARALMILAVVAWFLAAFLMGLVDRVNQPGRPPTVLLSFLVVPTVGLLLAYVASASFRRVADGLPLPLLVGSHLWRFVGVGFVIGWIVGALPAGFGIPAGFGDIVAALGALLLLTMLRRGSAPRGWLLAWNVWGLVDLVCAITMGLLYSESTFGVLSPGTPTTRLLVTFPVSLIPTFFVPLFLVLHALTFKRIADEAARARGGTRAVRRP